MPQRLEAYTSPHVGENTSPCAFAFKNFDRHRPLHSANNVQEHLDNNMPNPCNNPFSNAISSSSADFHTSIE